ncbi:MAG: CvpA family protein [Chloroflexia bacterium]|jgi:uncharacterized membrane protein required for colicin V production
MTIQDQIYTIWFPLGITLLLAIIGTLRGAVREGIVSAGLILAVLIITQWSAQWSPELHSLIPGMSQSQEEFILSFSVLWLVLIVVGYGMGGFVPRGPLSSTSRLSGFLVGLLNGAAVAGWSLRLAFQHLHDAQPSSPFYTTSISYAYLVWAAWYPIVLALLGAVLVLVGPLRRAQRAASEPSAQSDWTPYTVGTPGYTSAPVVAAGAGAALAASSQSQAPRGIVTPPPSPPGAPYLGQPTPYSSSTAPTMALPTQAPGGAPPSSSLPAGETPAPPPGAGSPSQGETDRSQPGGAGNTPDYGPWAAKSTGQPGWQSLLPDYQQPPAAEVSPTGAPIPETSPPAEGAFAREASPADAPVAGSRTSDEGATMPVAHVAEATSGQDTQVVPMVEAPQHEPNPDAAGAEQAQTCPNCGTPASPGTIFCTECGTKLG